MQERIQQPAPQTPAHVRLPLPMRLGLIEFREIQGEWPSILMIAHTNIDIKKSLMARVEELGPQEDGTKVFKLAPVDAGRHSLVEVFWSSKFQPASGILHIVYLPDRGGWSVYDHTTMALAS